jgi:YD repeat-containing protein
MTRSNGVNTGYTYDNLPRLLSVLHQLGGITKDGATYNYDNVGNRTGKTFVQQSDPDPISVVASYSYDNVYQLTQTQLNGGEKTCCVCSGN